jgi:hypothetical protein
VAGAPPEPRTGALAGLPATANATHEVVDGNRRTLRARAKDIAAGDRTGAAVKKAIEEVNAAVIIAIAAGGAVAGGASR